VLPVRPHAADRNRPSRLLQFDLDPFGVKHLAGPRRRQVAKAAPVPPFSAEDGG
jgi:hypothetical protein